LAGACKPDETKTRHKPAMHKEALAKGRDHCKPPISMIKKGGEQERPQRTRGLIVAGRTANARQLKQSHDWVSIW
jgi:hypothetical protein